MFIDCQTSPAFQLGEVLDIFKKEVNNPIINHASLGKTKTSNIIREGILCSQLINKHFCINLFLTIILLFKGIERFVTENLADRLKNTFFSATIDETTG